MTSKNTHPQADRLACLAQLAALPPDAVLIANEPAVYCGMGGSTWERMRAAGKTPPAIQITGRTLGYRKSVLDAWLAARTERRAA